MKRFALMLVLLVGACSSDMPPLTISDVIVKRPMPGMMMSAGYFSLSNNTSEPVVITHVTSPQFGSVEMHESVVEDGIARMIKLGDLTLAPESTVDFVPGGKHLMLMRPGENLDNVTLEFYAGDAVILSVNVAASE
jgi:copper(I)-binding protein